VKCCAWFVLVDACGCCLEISHPSLRSFGATLLSLLLQTCPLFGAILGKRSKNITIFAFNTNFPKLLLSSILWKMLVGTMYAIIISMNVVTRFIEARGELRLSRAGGLRDERASASASCEKPCFLSPLCTTTSPGRSSKVTQIRLRYDQYNCLQKVSPQSSISIAAYRFPLGHKWQLFRDGAMKLLLLPVVMRDP